MLCLALAGAINEAERQVVAADLIIINKVSGTVVSITHVCAHHSCLVLTRCCTCGWWFQCDVATPETAAELQGTLKRLNGAAHMVQTTHSNGACCSSAADASMQTK